jgi:hypothetical protein
MLRGRDSPPDLPLTTAKTRANRIVSGIINRPAKIITIMAGEATPIKVATGTRAATRMGTLKQRKETRISNPKARIMK